MAQECAQQPPFPALHSPRHFRGIQAFSVLLQAALIATLDKHGRILAFSPTVWGLSLSLESTGKTKLLTSTAAPLFSKMALTGQRIAMVDMVLLVFQHFHIYRGVGWSQSFPLKSFFSCSLGGGRSFSVSRSREGHPRKETPTQIKIICTDNLRKLIEVSAVPRRGTLSRRPPFLTLTREPGRMACVALCAPSHQVCN